MNSRARPVEYVTHHVFAFDLPLQVGAVHSAVVELRLAAAAAAALGEVAPASATARHAGGGAVNDARKEKVMNEAK